MALGFNGFQVRIDYGNKDNIQRIKLGLAQPSEEPGTDFDQLSDWNHFRDTWLGTVINSITELLSGQIELFGWRADFQRPDAPSAAEGINFTGGEGGSQPMPRNCPLIIRQQGFRPGAPRELVTSSLKLSGIPESQVTNGSVDVTWLTTKIDNFRSAVLAPFVTAEQEYTYRLAIVKLGTGGLYPEPLMVDGITANTILGTDKRRNVWWHKQSAPSP